jgi:hypothetical protein
MQFAVNLPLAAGKSPLKTRLSARYTDRPGKPRMITFMKEVLRDAVFRAILIGTA